MQPHFGWCCVYRRGHTTSRYIAQREGLNLFLLPDINDAWAQIRGVDIEERMLEWKQYREEIERDPYYVDWYRDKGFFGKLAHGLAHYAGQTYTWASTAAGQATWALLAALGVGAAAGVGKIAGIAAGPAGTLLSAQAPVAEEIVTSAASLAKSYGLLRAVQLSEMSGNYRDMEQERDIYGQGLDPYDMAKWSYVASLGQAPIELMQLQLAASWVPIRWFRPVISFWHQPLRLRQRFSTDHNF